MGVGKGLWSLDVGRDMGIVDAISECHWVYDVINANYQDEKYGSFETQEETR